MSPVTTTQFQLTADRMSNLDRCNLCGAPRSVHGIDWTCSPGTSRRHSALVVAAAGLVALAAIGVLTATSASRTAPSSIAAAVGLAILTSVVCALVLTGRR